MFRSCLRRAYVICALSGRSSQNGHGTFYATFSLTLSRLMVTREGFTQRSILVVPFMHLSFFSFCFYQCAIKFSRNNARDLSGVISFLFLEFSRRLILHVLSILFFSGILKLKFHQRNGHKMHSICTFEPSSCRRSSLIFNRSRMMQKLPISRYSRKYGDRKGRAPY